MDSVLNVKYFSILNSTLSDKNLRNSIRLLTVFGNNGSEVIFATVGDDVYGYGLNKSGCLGLGSFEQHVRRPKLNATLSGKRVVNIVCGFDHCIGITAEGQCYAWGQNEFGQLGIGSYDMSDTPQLIKRLAHKAVVQISCGRYHTLALTSDAQVYGWGRNMFGQLGDESYISRFIPKEIQFNDSEIVSISCGRMHSMALTDSGRVYVWGINESGQLGRHRECDIHMGREKACAYKPTLIPGYENTVFTKAICGPMHSLLLTCDGYVYAFGDNNSGQIGNGTEEPQFRPVKINSDIKFKDVVTYFENDLSIGITSDDQIYVWGMAKNKNVLTPTLINTESSTLSIFNVYAIYAKNKVTFKTFVINEELIDSQSLSHRSVVEFNKRMDTPFKVKDEKVGHSVTQMPNISMKNHISYENSGHWPPVNGSGDQRIAIMPNIVSFNGSYDENYLSRANNTNGVCRPHNSSPNDLNRQLFHSSMSNNSSNSELIIGNLFLKRLRQSFNNPNNCDLRIRCEDKVICCHKTILEIRNEVFWQLLRQKMVLNSDEIHINPDSYTAFYAFVQYIYGLNPNIDDQNVREVQNWANIFKEPELEDMCDEYIRRIQNTPNAINICSLYEKAITYGLKDLEKSCTEFAAINWRTIIKSNAFQTMNETLSKRLMISIIDN